MRDVDGRGTHAAMKALKLFARRGTELGVEVGEGFVEKKDSRLTNDGAGQSDPLTLTPGELARLAIEEHTDAEKRGRPLDFLFVQFFLYVLSLQRKRNVLVDREVWIERIALENHGDAAVARAEVVNHPSADKDFASRGRLQPGDHPQERRFSRS